MIPHQELLNRRKEPVQFLTWITRDEMAGLDFVCYQETFFQMIDTFYSVTVSFGLQRPQGGETLPKFRELCFQNGNALLAPPCLYLPCHNASEPVYLRFDWAMWLQQNEFILPLEGS